MVRNHFLLSEGTDAALKVFAPNVKQIGDRRAKVSFYRQIKSKYNNHEMFSLLEPVLFEFNDVTLQAADNRPKDGPGTTWRNTELPDNLVYSDGVDWTLILNNWVLPQVTKEEWDKKVAREAARFVELGYTPFSIPPFALWFAFAYEVYKAEPKAFASTLNKLKILTLRAKLAKSEALDAPHGVDNGVSEDKRQFLRAFGFNKLMDPGRLVERLEETDDDEGVVTFMCAHLLTLDGKGVDNEKFESFLHYTPVEMMKAVYRYLADNEILNIGEVIEEGGGSLDVNYMPNQVQAHYFEMFNRDNNVETRKFVCVSELLDYVVL
jgi:hypothetical protein